MAEPPLYDPDPDPDPSDDSAPRAQAVPPAAVKTRPAPAPLVGTGGIGTSFADPGDKARYLAAKRRGATEEQALLVGDPGIGAPALGKIDTAQAYGVAVPEDWLRKTYGDDPAAWRTARVQLKVGDKTITVPIVDIGPGRKARARGVVSDITDLLWKGLGQGEENPQVSIKLVEGGGPDYVSNRYGWDQEQRQIAAALAQPLALGEGAQAQAPLELGDMFPALRGWLGAQQ